MKNNKIHQQDTLSSENELDFNFLSEGSNNSSGFKQRLSIPNSVMKGSLSKMEDFYKNMRDSENSENPREISTLELLYLKYGGSLPKKSRSSTTNVPQRLSELFVDDVERSYVQKMFQTVVYYYCYVCVGFLNSVTGLFLNHIGNRCNVSESHAINLLIVKGVGMIVGTIFCGIFFDIFKKYENEIYEWYFLSINRSLLLIMMVMSLSLGFVPFSTNFFFVLVLHFFQGFATGGAEVGCTISIAWLWREKVGPLLQGLHCSSSAGSLLFPFIVAQVFTFVKDPEVQLKLCYLICCGLGLISVVLLIFIKSPKHAGVRSKESKFQNIVKSFKKPKELIKNTLNEVFSIDILIYCTSGVMKGCSTGVYSTFGNLLFPFAKKKKLGGDVLLAYLTTSFWLCFTFGRFLSIFLTIIINPFVLISYGFGITLIGYCIMIMFSNSLTGIFFGSTLHGLFTSPLSALITVCPTLSFEIDLTPISTSIVFLGSTIGEMIVPTIVTLFYDVLGDDSILFVLFSIVFFAFITMFVMYVIGKTNLYYKKYKEKVEKGGKEKNMKGFIRDIGRKCGILPK